MTGMNVPRLCIQAQQPTGFHVTDSPTFEHIIGKDGRSLAQVWEAEGMNAYKGSTVNGFPNMFLMVGPSTGLGHTSMVWPTVPT